MHTHRTVCHHARLPLYAPIWSGSRSSICSRVDRLVSDCDSASRQFLVRSPVVCGAGNVIDGLCLVIEIREKKRNAKQSESERAQGTEWIGFLLQDSRPGEASTIRVADAEPGERKEPNQVPSLGSGAVRGMAGLGYFCAGRRWRAGGPVRGGAGNEATLPSTTCIVSWLTALRRPAPESDRQLRVRGKKNTSIAKLFLFVLLSRSCRVGRGDEPNHAYCFWSTNSTSLKLGYTEGGEWTAGKRRQHFS